jgi:hypothetical protein
MLTTLGDTALATADQSGAAALPWMTVGDVPFWLGCWVAAVVPVLGSFA